MRDTAAVLVLSGADEVGESARVEVMAGEVIPLEVMALEVMAGQESVLIAAPVRPGCNLQGVIGKNHQLQLKFNQAFKDKGQQLQELIKLT